MNMLSKILFTMFFLGIMGMVMKRLHLLSMLLCLELLLMSLFLKMSLWSNMFGNLLTLKYSILLITFSACEASAGLALMVSLSRSHNTDLLMKVKLLQS